MVPCAAAGGGGAAAAAPAVQTSCRCSRRCLGCAARARRTACAPLATRLLWWRSGGRGSARSGRCASERASCSSINGATITPTPRPCPNIYKSPLLLTVLVAVRHAQALMRQNGVLRRRCSSLGRQRTVAAGSARRRRRRRRRRRCARRQALPLSLCVRARALHRPVVYVVSDSQPSSQPLILVHGAASAGWNVARCTRELPSEILLARASPLSAAPPYHTTTHLGVSKRDILLLHRPLAHGVVMNGSDSDDGPRWCSANTARLCARRTTRRPRSSKHRAALYWHDAAD